MENELKKATIESLKSLQKGNDIELNHVYADEVLCTFLTALGHYDVVDEYNKIKKWYA